MTNQAEMKKMERPVAPEGFVYNADGNLIARQNIPASELRKDSFVVGVISRVKAKRDELATFKADLFGSFENFRVEMAEEYNTKLHRRGSGNNVKIFSFDGKYRIDFRVADKKALGPEVDVMRDLTKKYYESQKDKLPHDVLVSVQSVMLDSISVTNVVRFISNDYQSPELKKAQEAARDALKVIGSKSYFTFYERDDNNEYQQIHLNFAKL